VHTTGGRDGIADDTAAITAAAAAAGYAGTVFFHPGGIYRITSTLSVLRRAD
jgi:hypothetical protein